MTGENVVPTTREVDPLLVKYLGSRDVVCPLCSYDLRGMATDACPDCGHQIVLAIQSPQRMQGLLVTGLVGLSTGMGFHVVLLGVASYQIYHNHYGSPKTGELIPSIMSAPILALLIWGWAHWWRYLSSFQLWKRLGMVTLCWALSVASVSWFMCWVS